MAIFRVEKNKNYTTMSNFHLRDKNLSLKSKGLLSVMLSLPNDWDYSLNGLVSISKENETAIKTALDELKKYGYLVINKQLPNETESKKIEYIYNIYEKPVKNQELEFQGVENQGLEFQGVENQTQLNTNKQNKEKQNKEKRNKENRKEKDVSDIISFYENNIDLITQKTSSILSNYLDLFKSKDIIIYAIQIAVYDNVKNVKYIEAILENWLKANVKSIEEAKDYTKKLKDYKAKKESKNNEETTEEQVNRLFGGDEW